MKGIPSQIRRGLPINDSNEYPTWREKKEKTVTVRQTVDYPKQHKSVEWWRHTGQI